MNEPLPGQEPSEEQLKREAEDFSKFMGAFKAGAI